MNEMQIVIPMSGFGERFRKAGYNVPKPLITVEGKPIIAHVLDLFPGEFDFIFICNQEHLNNREYRMAEILSDLCPTGRIIGIPPHNFGPVYAVKQIEYLLDFTRPVIVNYCDFTCYWDWHNFKLFVLQTQCDGAIPAYSGFHPHSLGTTNYAYLKESGSVGSGWVEDIQEKKSFTDRRMDEFASSGTYYFSSAKIMSDAFSEMLDLNLNTFGEFYVSLSYKSLLKKKKKVAIYPVEHFMQWGTPEDLMEYNYWSNIFKGLLSNNSSMTIAQGTLVIPMAGMGKRFIDYGYKTPKPLITVFEKPMAIQSAKDLPKSKYQSFVLRLDMDGLDSMKRMIYQYFPEANISVVPELTEGQASSALIGLRALEEMHDSDSNCNLSPITFGACDNGVIYNHEAYQALLDDPGVDVIVWCVRGYINAARNPQMYGWIDAQDTGRIKNILVKAPLDSPMTDPIVIGTFTFKSQIDASRAINALIERDGRINGEYYLDECINDAIAQGLSCHLFEVENYIPWGTPNDLKTFEYWQTCFHKWHSHPYRIENDNRYSS